MESYGKTDKKLVCELFADKFLDQFGEFKDLGSDEALVSKRVLREILQDQIGKFKQSNRQELQAVWNRLGTIGASIGSVISVITPARLEAEEEYKNDITNWKRRNQLKNTV